MTKIITLFILSLVLFSCGTYSEEQKKSFDQQIVAYLKKKDIKCTLTDSGLYYKIIEPGTGEFIQFTDIVSFSYKGSFMNGQTFDNHQYPVEFAVKDLIGAWKEIMLELKPGSKAFLVAPPTLGYGDRDLEDIPPNSILVFEMEIKGVK